MDKYRVNCKKPVVNENDLKKAVKLNRCYDNNSLDKDPLTPMSSIMSSCTSSSRSSNNSFPSYYSSSHGGSGLDTNSNLSSKDSSDDEGTGKRVGNLNSESSGFSSDEEIQKSLGYNVMKVDLEDIPMTDAKVKEVTGYLEVHGSTGPHVEKYIRGQVNAWQSLGSHVAVVGEAGVGKSALVNYLCGKNMNKFKLKKKRRSCKRPKPTSHATNPYLQFWEVPLGMGCENPKYGNKKLYWDAIQGDKFDAFILVTRNYVKGLMTWFSKLLREKNIPHFIVRTAIDESISSSKKRYPSSHNSDRIINNAFNLITKSYLDNGGIFDDKFTPKNNFFVLDSFKGGSFHMPALMDGLLYQSSDAIRTSMALSLPATSNQIVTAKIEALRKRIWLISLECAAAGSKIKNLTDIYCDYKMIKDEISMYKKQLNISDAVLETVGDYDDPLAGLNDIKYNNQPLYTMLEASVSKQRPDQLIHRIKNVSFRWWLQHQKALPSFCAVSGMLKFLLLNFEDLSRRMLSINNRADSLSDPCASD